MNKNIKNWLIQWIIWAITMLVIWVTYASTVTWWTTLTADLFNEKTVPTWAVMAFFWDTCPTWWNAADWSWDETRTNWTLDTLDLTNQFIRWASSTRLAWTSQAQDFKSFTITTSNEYYYHSVVVPKSWWSWRWVFWSNRANSWCDANWCTGNAMKFYWDSSEIRPANVALLYCVKN